MQRPFLLEGLRGTHEAVALPSAGVGLCVVLVAKFGQRDIVDGPSVAGEGSLRHIFEAHQNLSADVGTQVNPVFDPFRSDAPSADSGIVWPEVKFAVEGHCLTFEELPALSAIPRDRDVAKVGERLDVVPGPILERSSLESGQVEGPGEGHVAIVASIRPPEAIAAMR